MPEITATLITELTPETIVSTATDGKEKYIAGTAQVTKFAMEEVTDKTFEVWSNYVGRMGIASKKMSKFSRETFNAGQGFMNGLAMQYLDPNCRVYIAYSNLDIDKNAIKEFGDDIQMAMTVCTDINSNFPAVTHMGIFRSPLLALNKEVYQGKTSRNIAIPMHAFAAKAVSALRPDYHPQFMITAPMPKMGEILATVGHINIKPTKTAKQKVEFDYKSQKYEWLRKDHRWIFELAFNSQHGLPSTFTDFRALKEMHPSMIVSVSI